MISGSARLPKIFPWETFFKNTISYGKTVPRIEFSYRVTDRDLVIIYQDNGEGVPAEHKEEIFDCRSFKQNGFGLFLSRSILGISGMTILETKERGKGARFEILVRREPTGSQRVNKNSLVRRGLLILFSFTINFSSSLNKCILRSLFRRFFIPVVPAPRYEYRGGVII
jgi:Histidine kinase-, DNA gyrase B-, and HSP90-like ATPase